MTVKRVKQAKSRKSLFHFKPEKVNKTFRNKTFSKSSAETAEKACLYKTIWMHSVLCVCKSPCKLTLGNKSLPKQKTLPNEDTWITSYKI